MTRAVTTLADVALALEAIAPRAAAEPWDNVGLLAGDLASRVTRVLLCIDLMPAVVREAVRKKQHLVISYHPPIFRPITRLIEPGDDMEAGVHHCIRHGIAIYSPHTALDVAPGGTNDVLAKLCDMQDPAPLSRGGEPPQEGIGRIGALSRLTLAELARKLRRRTGARCVSIVGDPARKLRRAIVVVGAAGDLPFAEGLRRGDVVVTGEIRHHDALRILREGATAIALSHWSSERPALAALGQRLASMLRGVTATPSEADAEPFARV